MSLQSDAEVGLLRMFEFELGIAGQHPTILWRVLIRGLPTTAQLYKLLDDSDKDHDSCSLRILKSAVKKGVPKSIGTSVTHKFNANKQFYRNTPFIVTITSWLVSTSIDSRLNNVGFIDNLRRKFRRKHLELACKGRILPMFCFCCFIEKPISAIIKTVNYTKLAKFKFYQCHKCGENIGYLARIISLLPFKVFKHKCSE